VVAILREIRKAKGMTLDQVGKRSGLLPETVSRAERDGVDARFSTVVAIASALDTPLCALVEGQGKHGKYRRQRRKA
jgi:transcriptional regulator with XRE-family HTH domain